MTKSIIPHNPRWKEAYEAEAQALRDALGDTLVAIHHT